VGVYDDDAIRKPTTISRPSNCNDLSALTVVENREKSPHALAPLFIFPLISPVTTFKKSRGSFCCQMGTLLCNDLERAIGSTRTLVELAEMQVRKRSIHFCWKCVTLECLLESESASVSTL
jgi:hypothetical protein